MFRTQQAVLSRRPAVSGQPSRRLLAAVGAIAFAAAACASSAGALSPVGNPVTAATAAPTAAPSAAAPAPPATGVGGGATEGGQDFVDQASGPLIIRTGSLGLEVKDLDNALLQARGKIVGLGGYVSDSERSNQGDQSTALITYRIPAARWDEALDDLRGVSSRVVSEDTKAQDVTGTILDLGARIDNLKATERALQAIMAQATKISDVLDVQNQLTTVRGQIEELSTQQAHLNDQAAMGTLAVTYTLPIVAVVHASAGFSLAAEFDRAAAYLVQMGQGLAVLLVWLGVVVLPVAVGFVLLAGLAVFVSRRFGSRRVAAPPAA
jgi:hypothetical protein